MTKPRRALVLGLSAGVLLAAGFGAWRYRAAHGARPAGRPQLQIVAAPGAVSGAARAPGVVLNAVGYQMVRLDAGEFQMGSPADEAGRYPDEALHSVTLTRPFLLGATEVDGALWERAAVMRRPGQAAADPTMPIHSIDWLSAVLFCQKLSELEGLPPAYAIAGSVGGVPKGGEVQLVAGSMGYRLPTEAEWEYAARLGSSGAVALSDMSGSLWEWVWDRPGEYPDRATDPTGSEIGRFHVLRGGSWRTGAAERRAAMRGWSPLFVTDDTVGFRIARTLPASGGSPPS